MMVRTGKAKIMVPIMVAGEIPTAFDFMVKHQKFTRYLEKKIKDCPADCRKCPVSRWCKPLYDSLVNLWDSGTESRHGRVLNEY